MSDRTFLLVAAFGVAVGSAFLAAAAVWDRVGLAVAGALAIAATLIAREIWLWSGDGRGWFWWPAAVALIVAIALLAQGTTT